MGYETSRETGHVLMTVERTWWALCRQNGWMTFETIALLGIAGRGTIANSFVSEVNALVVGSFLDGIRFAVGTGFITPGIVSTQKKSITGHDFARFKQG